MNSSKLTATYTFVHTYEYTYIHMCVHLLTRTLWTSDFGASDIPVVFGASYFRVPTSETSNLTSAHVLSRRIS
ncbi:hypothetical protein Y032_0027g1559 [Ancylostoma ceylanicum]|uniref:Uncharacterized protein n=1 Tax=Ancylostoma ceylanicum TaxID=53326 RepID=A0A016UUN8_9BILA|nr:hypothetical protein Y032_0027g1559 [Ancylostoma ceylanicum]